MTEATNAEVNKIVAVSNTGPLISAFQCSSTDLLRRYFSVIYILTSVRTELNKHGWRSEIHGLIKGGLVKVVKLTKQEKKQAKYIAKRIAAVSCSGNWRNHLPEAEAMALMKQRASLKIDQILLDEKAARDVAKELNLNLTGFPGVLGRAKKNQLLAQDDVRQLLKTCQKQGTYYSNQLIEAVART